MEEAVQNQAQEQKYVYNSLPAQQKLQKIKGQSRIEYVPYVREVVEYEQVHRVDVVPKLRKITDYYAVEHQVEYVPEVFQDVYLEYVPR